MLCIIMEAGSLWDGFNNGTSEFENAIVNINDFFHNVDSNSINAPFNTISHPVDILYVLLLCTNYGNNSSVLKVIYFTPAPPPKAVLVKAMKEAFYCKINISKFTLLF